MGGGDGLIRSPHDAEEAARQRLAELGFTDAAVTGAGADGGVDIEAAAIVGQVKAEMVKTARPVVQGLAGVAGVEGKQAAVFSLTGFTDEAVVWADRAGVALFAFDLQGDAQPVSAAALNLVNAQHDANRSLETGDALEPAAVAAALTELLAGERTDPFDTPHYSVWVPPHGEIISLTPTAGDADQPADVGVHITDVDQFPELRDSLDDRWTEHTHRTVGDKPSVSAFRSVHKPNQPVYVTAGEAVTVITELLATLEVPVDQCRVIIGPTSAELGAADFDSSRLPHPIAGPIRHDLDRPVADGESASVSHLAATVLTAADTLHTVVGEDAAGDVQWQLAATDVDQPSVVAWVAGPLLAQTRKGGLLHPAEAVVGDRTWTSADDGWTLGITADTLEMAAKMLVAELVTVFIRAGEPIDDTVVRMRR